MLRHLLAVSIILGIGFLNIGSGQSTSGSLVGSVTDSTGATIQGANVRVTNTATSTSIEAISNEGGDYSIANLPAATYTIHAEVKGFRSVQITGLRLLLNQSLRTDIRMEPGAVEQSITVSAGASVVQSESASVGTNIDAHSLSSGSLLTGARSIA